MDSADLLAAPTRPSGVPTARAVDHYAFTVTDLPRAVAFCTEVLGGELCYEEGPIVHPDSDWMARKLGVHPRARTRVALVRLHDANLELFGYDTPDQVRVPPPPGVTGNAYLALAVADLPAALTALDTVPQARVETTTVDPVGGTRIAWCRTDLGLWLQLRQGDDPPARGRYRPRPRPAGGTAPAVAGIQGVEHFGRAVADLPAAVTFFVDVLGAEPITAGQPAPGRGAASPTVALRLGPTANLELVAGSPAPPQTPRNSDIGGHHLAIYVDDVDVAASALAGVPGVVVMGEPETITSGPLVGDRWVYFRTPIGLQMELVNMPDGRLPYEATTTARRATPGAHRWHDRP
ncbi:VOC family protein [Solwaraspora sp. WMMD791]|uniref:VOC family protein n=1 Tax=Solwaraspora sp. WMMD791 TaxID=3016086 RepID=UPI00249B8060|nr:VOC family protein [Solwaraspora sp. WMMD791]WFE28333.1 VOC family protein [Solwaraspora sp. WMMD791]